ncbi:MAG: cysteine desulfurase, partial [Phycisphaerales bacterium]|nr:cysteine desulfurase [Phycisphaerales bacterium]
HQTGQRARAAVETARGEVAMLLGGVPEEVIFTSGGTESANTAITSALAMGEGKRVIVTSSVEHAAVRELVESRVPSGIEHVLLPPTDVGPVDPGALEEVLQARADEIAMVSVMWANNETGIIEPIEQLAEMTAQYGIPFHSDATQWIGKLPVNVSDTPITMLSTSGHKFHGPKGSGLLWTRVGTSVSPSVIGGGQESGRRGGTENVPAIIGLGVAAQEAREWLDAGGHRAMPALRDRFEQGVRDAVPDMCVNGENAPRMWSTSNIGFPSMEAELLLLVLSERGLDASAGSACSSGALKPSSVLDAMPRPPCQVDDQQYGSVRFSWCRGTTEDELDHAVEIIAQAIEAIASLPAPASSIGSQA